MFGVITALVILAIFIAERVSSRAKQEKIKEQIQKQFGMIPDDADLDFSSISTPWKIKFKKECPTAVDDITWNDLDMNEVFGRINACHTSLGEEYLYTALHRLDINEAQEREDLINTLEENPELRFQLQFVLEQVGKKDYNGLTEFIGGSEIHGLPHAWIYPVFALLPILFLPLFFADYVLATVCVVGAVCLNILISYFTKKKFESELPSVRYLTSVLWCCKKICQMNNNNLSAVKDTMHKCLSALHGVSSAASGSMENKFIKNDFDTFLEYGRSITLSDIRSYNKLIRIISGHKESCLTLCEELAKLDMAISVLSFRKSLPFYSKPNFIRSMQLNLQDIYHPLLQDGVPNSVLFTGDSLITGSNASGKSTFIKAVAVNAILADALNTCAARVFQAPKALIVSSMAIRDNITAGDSYFIAEIKSLKRVLENAKSRPCICIIDEILKGTNTVERIAASVAVLRFLHRQNSLCLVASHDIELTQLLENEFENYHFSEEITNQEIIFDYLIKPGPSKTTNAVKLLAYTGYETEIIHEAEAMVDQYEQSGTWVNTKPAKG